MSREWRLYVADMQACCERITVHQWTKPRGIPKQTHAKTTCPCAISNCSARRLGTFPMKSARSRRISRGGESSVAEYPDSRLPRHRQRHRLGYRQKRDRAAAQSLGKEAETTAQPTVNRFYRAKPRIARLEICCTACRSRVESLRVAHQGLYDIDTPARRLLPIAFRCPCSPMCRPLIRSPCRLAGAALRNRDAVRPGGLEADHPLEPRRLLDWQVGRPRAFQYAVDVDDRAPEASARVRSIGHEPAGLHVRALLEHGRDAVAHGEVEDAHQVEPRKRLGGDEQRLRPREPARRRRPRALRGCAAPRCATAPGTARRPSPSRVRASPFRVGRIPSAMRDIPGARTCSSSRRLALSCGAMSEVPVMLPPRAREAVHQAHAHGIAVPREHDRDRIGRLLQREARRRADIQNRVRAQLLAPPRAPAAAPGCLPPERRWIVMFLPSM